MTYQVVFLNVFLRQFKRLQEDMQRRVKDRVQELAENPHLGLRLRGQLEGFLKDRVGGYRIIYKVDESAKKIVLYDVDLRKRIYK